MQTLLFLQQLVNLLRKFIIAFLHTLASATTDRYADDDSDKHAEEHGTIVEPQNIQVDEHLLEEVVGLFNVLIYKYIWQTFNFSI